MNRIHIIISIFFLIFLSLFLKLNNSNIKYIKRITDLNLESNIKQIEIVNLDSSTLGIFKSEDCDKFLSENSSKEITCFYEDYFGKEVLSDYNYELVFKENTDKVCYQGTKGKVNWVAVFNKITCYVYIEIGFSSYG